MKKEGAGERSSENERPDEELVGLAQGGDKQATEELLSRYAGLVRGRARGFFLVGGETEDLIQEGNLGLLTALEEMEEMESAAAYQAFLLNRISRAMEDSLSFDKKEKEFGEKLAGKANRLHQAARDLEEELEHKVSPEELSAFLEIPLEEIRDLMRMTADQIGQEEDQ